MASDDVLERFGDRGDLLIGSDEEVICLMHDLAAALRSARESEAQWRVAMVDAQACADRLRERIAELERDRERLDWLLSRGAMTVVDGDDICVDREQLDAAMAAERGGE